MGPLAAPSSASTNSYGGGGLRRYSSSESAIYADVTPAASVPRDDIGCGISSIVVEGVGGRGLGDDIVDASFVVWPHVKKVRKMRRKMTRGETMR